MQISSLFDRRSAPSLGFVALLVFVLALWLTGGASRADVAAQAPVRGAAWLLLAVLVLFGKPGEVRHARGVLWLLLAAIALGILQLIPLPPVLWQALPGRALIAEAAASGQPQPWRPLSLVPGATVNAVMSLAVPLAMLVAAAGLTPAETRRLPAVLLLFASASAFVGLLQFSQVGISNPLMNDSIGQVSGTFANRNHFALLMAIGLLITPVWAFGDRAPWRKRMQFALPLMLLFMLILIASGSRVGLLVGLLGLAIGFVIVRPQIRRAFGHLPRWALPAAAIGLVAILGLTVLLSIAADRAVSIDRLMSADAAQDIRRRALPTVIDMIATYFPLGSGLGGFDPLFRMHEPFELLKTTYFNHAHNDYLEVVLDAGLAGVALLLTALLWWGWMSIRAWRSGGTLARLGSAMLLLIAIASIFDYPGRTPIIMALMALAGLWLGGRPPRPAA